MEELKYTYYSQFKEDQILNRIFKGKKDGVCVEIGGFDGVTGSTTFFFEKLGWRCLVVEPIPELYHKILVNRNCKVVNCAASRENGTTDFFVATGVEMLSSITPDAGRINKEKGELSRISVEKRTLDSILIENSITQIDFMSIDVEGHEMEVLGGFSLEKFHPTILIIEDNSFGFNREIKTYLENKGWVRFRLTGCNEWYTHCSNKSLINKVEIIYLNVFESFRMKIILIKKWIKSFLNVN